MRHFLSPDNLSFGWDQFPADYSYYLKTLNSDPVKVQIYILNHEKSIPRPEGEGVPVGGKQSSHAGLGQGQRSSKITLGAVHNNEHFLLFIWTKQSLWQFLEGAGGPEIMIMDFLFSETLNLLNRPLQTQSKSPRLFYSLAKCNCHSCSFQIFESVLSLVLYNVWTLPSSELC